MLKKLSSDSVVCIYEKKEHKINNNLIDKDAIKIIQKIVAKGERAYIVGGAVRDLIIGKEPKDFDIATSMTPQTLRKFFKNVKIIGRRFKLAHFIFQNNKIIEVATFRSIENNEDTNNIYGTMEEDVFRRDFTINALYYDPLSCKLYDFLNGFDDLQNRRLVPIINIDTIFREDPVRMIRAIKYTIKDNLTIEEHLSSKIRETASLIATISSSRLAEELNKVFISGQSHDIFVSLQEYGLLNYLLPKVSYDLKISNPVLLANLKFFDTVVNNFDFNRNRIVELGIFSIVAHMFNRIRILDDEHREVIKRELMVQLKIIFIHFNIANKTFENVIKMLIDRTSILFDRASLIDPSEIEGI